LQTERSPNALSGPELARLLLVELLRDDVPSSRFANAWILTVWQPLGLFERLQSEGHVRRHISAAALARMFLSLNLGYLFGRHILAPGTGWNKGDEIAAIAALFTRGAQDTSKHLER
jgi:hypothetical protein